MNKKKMSKKRIVWIVILIVVVGGVFAVWQMRRGNGGANSLGPVVKVERGDVIEKALAVGSIVPRNEVSIKSKVSGVVKRVFKEPGEKVRAGESMLEIRPDPTPLELAEAKRTIEMNEIAIRTVEKHLDRSKELLARGLISNTEYEQVEKEYE